MATKIARTNPGASTMRAVFSEFKEPPTAIVTIASKNPKTVTTTHSREEMNLRPGITEFFRSGS
jgi:hypothetical protein